MISKNQARHFFLAVTFVTFSIFIGLTIYSLTKVEVQTNADKITPKVVAGNKCKQIQNSRRKYELYL